MNVSKNLISKSILSLSIAASFALSMSSAFATDPNERRGRVTPESVVQKARSVRTYLLNEARYLEQSELRAIDRALSKILDGTLEDQGPGYPGGQGPGHGGPGHGGPGGPGPGPGGPHGPGPGPGPGYPPNPGPGYPRSECRLLGPGAHNGYSYNFRMSVNNQVMEGSNNMDTILARIEQYRRDGICQSVVADPLQLAASGAYNGYSYNFRVLLGGTPISGSNNLETAIDTMNRLSTARVGVIYAASQPCQMLSAGAYNGYSYNYRVGVGSSVMSGSNNYQTIIDTMQTLRAASVCY